MMSKGINFVVTEYVDGGDLRSILVKERKQWCKNPLLDIVSYPAKKRLQYALDIAEGIAFYIQKIYSS